MAALTLTYEQIEEILNSDIFWSKLGSRTFLCLLVTLLETKLKYKIKPQKHYPFFHFISFIIENQSLLDFLILTLQYEQ